MALLLEIYTWLLFVNCFIENKSGDAKGSRRKNQLLFAYAEAFSYLYFWEIQDIVE